LEAFKRYRTGGEQKVTVQHVSVSEGGQAIVGNVTQPAGGTAPEKPVTTRPALTDTRQRAMPIIETTAEVLPLRTKKNDGGRLSAYTGRSQRRLCARPIGWPSASMPCT
jgi:hypothetical protein